MPGFCVYSFTQTEFADTSCYFAMEMRVDFQTVTFCSTGKRASTWLSMKVVPGSSSMARFLTTLKSTHVTKSPVLTFSMTLS